LLRPRFLLAIFIVMPLLRWPAAWNRLPETIRQAQTQTLLNKLLKTVLLTEFYNCC